ncbi:MAG: DUF969 domain-containing protein [Holdemanella sp.]|nr:DUF969 domain-containing protein [Holdemanella sp.]
MEYIKLVGILIIVVGFALKLDTLAVVLIAGIVTGLVSGISITDILATLGTGFVSNRLMSIFLIMFPVIAVIERYGLKERAAYLIGNIKNASSGKVCSIYMFIRVLASAFNIRIGGHVQFIRPLIYPMALGAAEKYKGAPCTTEEDEAIKGLTAAVENYGNFFAQNCFPAASGVVLIQGTIAAFEGCEWVQLADIAKNSIWICVIATILTVVQVNLYDRKLKGGNK